MTEQYMNSFIDGLRIFFIIIIVLIITTLLVEDSLLKNDALTPKCEGKVYDDHFLCQNNTATPCQTVLNASGLSCEDNNSLQKLVWWVNPNYVYDTWENQNLSGKGHCSYYSSDDTTCCYTYINVSENILKTECWSGRK